MDNSDWLGSGHMATSEPVTVAEGRDIPTNQLRVTLEQEVCQGGVRLGVGSGWEWGAGVPPKQSQYLSPMASELVQTARA